ncbi:MAG: tetratricopeptide repeat protein [Candidatus Brocadiae bacterium]|nr:tetratricopeptide repeat protein [Candidatus Brocadiia bacterium]
MAENKGYCMKIFYMLFYAILAISLGCQIGPPKSSFYAHEYEKALDACKQTVEENPTGKNYAYHRLFLASVAFTMGRYQEANQALREALKVMESYGNDETKELMAMVGSERGKEYKGDPFEKMMAHFYTGMTFYFMGDYVKALAGFKNALGADMMSPREEYKRDCVLMHFMAAKACFALGEEENAAMFLREALSQSPKNPYLDFAKLKKSNLLILVEAGKGPGKRAVGSGESVELLEKIDFPEDSVEILINGESMGKASLMADVFAQADTCGRSKASSLREAKGVAGDLAMGMPLLQSKADTRVWSFLPGKVFGFCKDVPEGFHTITLRFYDKEGAILSNYEQTWYYCPVKKDTVYCFRSGKNKGNSEPDGNFVPKPLQPPATKTKPEDAKGLWPGTQQYENFLFGKKGL